MRLRSLHDFRPCWANLWTPPLHFWRRPPQSNCPPNSVPRPDSRAQVRISVLQEWYPNGASTKAGALASKAPTYPVHEVPKSSIKLQ